MPPRLVMAGTHTAIALFSQASRSRGQSPSETVVKSARSENRIVTGS